MLHELNMIVCIGAAVHWFNLGEVVCKYNHLCMTVSVWLVGPMLSKLMFDFVKELNDTCKGIWNILLGQYESRKFFWYGPHVILVRMENKLFFLELLFCFICCNKDCFLHYTISLGFLPVWHLTTLYKRTSQRNMQKGFQSMKVWQTLVLIWYLFLSWMSSFLVKGFLSTYLNPGTGLWWVSQLITILLLWFSYIMMKLR